MGYTESEKVELKKEFLRMLVRLELDEARQRLLLGFFETYVKLSEEEEQQLQREVKAMETKEREKVLELIISYEQKGRKAGWEEGMKRGLQQGIKQGMKQGMKQLIRNMARKGMTEKDIAQLVDLPVEDVRALLEE
ncbi:UNVERIFIED_ORG: putative transposase/invertase (TIGR01784 family) [Anoxybacillus amylolyticus]|uniref:Transposase n=1 Tax=Geobacillus thermoleovorans CCB_US3_UF5 TaxID=1111068 RepID=A0ABM5MJ53_GEOTH|nr:hypothetical protein GTCCBUS3UF5_23940 [Geobacillus thermoleovorans CCB_US3_UF5]GAJ58551.1 hypothetical protein B23_1762 [Geobacillus thermoleovorans B23]